jgi:hypothetical protein
MRAHWDREFESTSLRTRVPNVETNLARCRRSGRVWPFGDRKATGVRLLGLISDEFGAFSPFWILAVDFGLPRANAFLGPAAL